MNNLIQADLFNVEEPEPEKDARDEGYHCPCCKQFVKRYTRKLGSSMAAVLILLYRNEQYGFLHIENWLKQIGKPELRADFHKLILWGLLEKKDGERLDKSPRNGFYKITGRGIAFASGNFVVREKVKIFNNQFEGFEGEIINIKKALGNRFSYEELMEA